MTTAGSGAALTIVAVAALSCAHVKPYYETSEICALTRPDPARVLPASLIDDAEEGRDQIVVHGGRDGFLYLYFDDATQLVRNPGDHGNGAHPIAGGANGSRCAFNIRGKLADRLEPFAGLGFNMRDPMAPYDASRYAGISFVARRSAQTTPRIVVKFSDWNTQPPGCTECFNFFHREIVLEEQWTRYTVLFDSVEQYPNWGAPRPERIDPTRLYGIMFEANEAGHPFDVWIDDIAFIEKTPGQK